MNKQVKPPIQEAEELLEELQKLKKKVVSPRDGKTIIPKIVWVYDGFMQAALYRITDIASDALELWHRKKVNSSIILSRSLMETASASYWLIKRAERKIAANDFIGASDDVETLSFASRSTDGLPDGKSVLTYIDEVEKIIPGYRDVYAIMCDVSHPNHLGTLWAYSDMVKESYEVIFFDNHPDAEIFLENNMPSALNSSLLIMDLALSEYQENRPGLIELGREDMEKYTKPKSKK